MVTSTGDKWFNSVVYVLLTLAALAAVIPMILIVSVSLTPIEEVMKHGGYLLYPTKVTFDAYKQLFSNDRIPNAFLVTVYITVVGTAINMLLTTLMAYPLSRKKLPGRSAVLLMIVFTMLFSGGMIPTYLVVKETGLLNTLWAMMIPNAIGVFNILIMKSFFEQLPEELFESARIDGAKELRVLLRIVIPLSIPVMITVGLFYLVMHWNEFFHAVLYVTKNKLHPLQVVLREILAVSQNSRENVETVVPTATFQMAAVMVACLPVIVVYPFMQKHLTRGMLIGAIKG
jgi:putative aldouronate transport system permease protein